MKSWRHALAVEPLLQRVERLDPVVAHDQELAVDGAVEARHAGQIRKALGDILAGARIEPGDALAVGAGAGHGLHADAVPFPLGDERRRIEPGEVGVLDRVGEHYRAKRRRVGGGRFFRAALDPGEQIQIGRLLARPDQLDLVRILVAEGGDRGLRQPRRHADPQRPGHQLEQRPTAGLVERIEPARKLRRKLELAERGQRRHHLGQRRRLRVTPVGGFVAGQRRWPDQRHRLGEIADIVVGELEQHRVDPLGGERADDAGLGMGEAQRRGERRERPAALGVRGRAEIVGHQAELGVAAVLVGQAVEQRGEPVHALRLVARRAERLSGGGGIVHGSPSGTSSSSP